MPDFSVFSRLSDYVSSLVDHVQRLRGRERGYVFALDVEENSLLLYRYFFAAYLRRFPHRYAGASLTEVPEFRLALGQLSRTELNGFTRYVISRLCQPRDRFDFQFYAVAHGLLAQLLARRPWANETEMLRLGEDLCFLSPFGYDGVVYWPLEAYLRSVAASYGGRLVSDRLADVLRMMDDELRACFCFGYASDVAQCQYLLHALLHPEAARAAGTVETEYAHERELPAVA